ncbi:phage tail fiber protein [uncultured Enterobacter sp.]|uniref:phage tail fiber domain-containing protein n=1 Tax=uncultured Enterobacter sp. TaxID=238202 RepID=UPI00266FEE42|nr:phage tail fiber protein [uncultured Enterobacter sp.]
MSVPNQTPYIIYNANGMTTVFPFEFYVINAGDIQVTVNGTVVTSGFSVSGVGNVGGGDVVFVTPPASGAVVMLERVVPTYRLTDYQDNGDLLADTVNKDFDRLWMAIQRSFIYLGLALRRPLFGGPFDAQGYRIANLGDPINAQDAATKNYVDNVSLVRTLRVPESSVSILPPVDQRANKLLAFNAAGQPIVVLPASGSASDVMIELAKPDGEKYIGECQTIAILRTIEPSYDKQRITVREHTAGTRKGGGQFRAVLSGTGYTDNNGTVVKTTGGAAWLRINAEITNPLMFGAQAVAGADDSSAINAAIAATTAECDGLGYSYQIASTVAINQPNKRFRKARISLTSAAAVSTVMFRIRANYAEVIECVFDGNGGANTSAALIWEGALCQVGGVVRNCQFLYCGANGISVTPDYANNLFNNGGVIQDCFFQTCGSTNPNDNRRCSILADGVSNFRIQGCDIRKSNWGIYVRQDTGLAGRPRKSGNKILDCHVEGSGRTHATYTVAQGLSANRQEGMIVNNVRVHDFADNGFDFGSSRNCQISNAYFNSVKDAIFIGDISCERYNISNVIAESCDRGVRIVMDGTIYPVETAQQIRISNMQVFDPNYTGFFIVNTGATTVMKDIELVNCNVDSTNSYSLSTYNQAYRIIGCQFVELLNCSANVNKQAAIYIKASELVSVRGGVLRSSAKDGSNSYAVTVENDSNRVSISDVMMFGEPTAGAVLLAGGSGHSVKHTRWRSMTGGVSSSSATSPYLLDNIAF